VEGKSQTSKLRRLPEDCQLARDTFWKIIEINCTHMIAGLDYGRLQACSPGFFALSRIIRLISTMIAGMSTDLHAYNGCDMVETGRGLLSIPLLHLINLPTLSIIRPHSKPHLLHILDNLYCCNYSSTSR
jgi:hypothetical protein